MTPIFRQKGSAIELLGEPSMSDSSSRSTVKERLFYTDTHLWLARVNEVARIGLTDYAQSQLPPIMFVAPLMAESGWPIHQGDLMLVIDSMLEAISLYTPVDGKVLTVNPLIQTVPEKINEDPYGEGWLIELHLNEPKQLDSLMNAQEYGHFVEMGRGAH